MSISFEVVVFLVLLALAFDFLNGFHDAANSIATIVSTGAMSPHWAVAWAAFFNFVAFLVFGFAVATTIGKGIVDPAIVDHYVVFGALCGATTWNLITWYYGIPSSSSHALVGGIIGAGVAKAGVGKLVAGGGPQNAPPAVVPPPLRLRVAPPPVTLGASVLRLGEWRDDAVPRHRLRHPGVHHAHHYRLDHRRGLGEEAVRRALGGRRQHYLGMGFHDSRLGFHRRSGVAARNGIFLVLHAPARHRDRHHASRARRHRQRGEH